MSQEKYTGMDVHQATISVAVMDAHGKLLMECLLETKAARSRMPSGTFGAVGLAANPTEKCPIGPIASSHEVRSPPAKVTSNDPVLSRIRPIALRTRPSSMRGRNIQYFLRIAVMARSCSLRSVRNRAVPSNVSPPIDNLTCGVFCTLRTHCRFTFAVPMKSLSPSRTNQIVTSCGFPVLRP